MDPREQAVLTLAASKEFELGKFFFTITTATAGFLLTAEKMNTTPEWKGLLLLGLLLLALSMVVAVYMTMVSPAQLSSQDWVTKLVAYVNPTAWTCFALWLVGTICGAIAVLPS